MKVTNKQVFNDARKYTGRFLVDATNKTRYR